MIKMQKKKFISTKVLLLIKKNKHDKLETQFL